MVLVGVVALSLVTALVAVGPSLVRSYLTTKTIVAAPFP